MERIYMKNLNFVNNITPEEIYRSVISRLNSMREGECNKGTFGTLACICGSYGMAGAAMLCGSAALTCGSGIVKMILPQSIYPIAASNLWEAVFVPVEENDDGMISHRSADKILESIKNCSAVAIGCGLGVSDDTEKLVSVVLEKCDRPVVLDADGINCVCRHIDVLKRRRYPTVLTPHPGEMARLTGRSIAEIQSSRVQTAESFAKEYNCTLVLKGTQTVTTDGENTVINTTGNGRLAKGGSGDVLTGITGALICQGTEIFSAAAAAVYLHGLAADVCAQSCSPSCATARDIISSIKKLM